VAGFPTCNVCNGDWQRMGIVVNSAIDAVRDAAASSTIKPKIILHVADPKNVEWWFDNLTDATKGNVKDFDIIGFSFYPLWHTDVQVPQLSDNVSRFKSRYGKPVMILEVAYPWTAGSADSYNNQFGSQTPIDGYPFTQQGQLDLMTKITQELLDGGGTGVLWGQGSSWENTTLFDFDGNAIQGMGYMTTTYKKN
jgi:arabinogalactan endo-1,4-beta-galactosidase